MTELEYNPLQWPPDTTLSQLHYDCCKPGIDNTEGRSCPCCQRMEKLSNSKWPLRNIRKDFRRFGGGVPGYFYLLLYLIVVIVILIGVKAIYHIMLIVQVCPTLVGSDDRCAHVFGLVWVCDNAILHRVLVRQGRQLQANILQYLQLANYLILVVATLGIKIFLHILGKNTALDEKLFSNFALIIKNVPLYYQLEDLKEELRGVVPGLGVAQMFYLHKTCEYEISLRGLVDLHFNMRNTEKLLSEDSSPSPQQDRGKWQEEHLKMKEEYLKMKERFLKLFDKYEREGSNLKASSKKVIMVFNTLEEKEQVHKHLRMGETTKFWYYFRKLVGCRSESIGYYSERIAEPQEIYWKYIGESSTQKQKVRVETTLIGVGLVLVAFLVLYFPMFKIDEEKVLDPLVGTLLGMVISVCILTMIFSYRAVIAALMPTRRPSSKLAEGYFVVIAISLFFFFFILVSPAVYYVVATSIPNNFKLATFFMEILLFCISNIVLAMLDIGFRLFNSKKKRLLGQVREANKFCQGRLHEELTPQAFPLAFKLVVAFNMWSFNSYYSFNIPYLMIVFLIVLVSLYWIDKYILYNHYKTSLYLSMEVEHQAQKIILLLFLFCVTFGYLTISQEVWERYLTIGVFLTAVFLNFALQFMFKKEKEEIRRHNTDLRATLSKCRSDLKAATLLTHMEAEMKSSFVFNDPKAILNELSEASLASAIVMYGYQETYELYLSQFHRKEVHSLIEGRFLDIKRTHSTRSHHSRPQRRESELPLLVPSTQQHLIESAARLATPTKGQYQPPESQKEEDIPQKEDAAKKEEDAAKKEEDAAKKEEEEEVLFEEEKMVLEEEEGQLLDKQEQDVQLIKEEDKAKVQLEQQSANKQGEANYGGSGKD